MERKKRVVTNWKFIALLLLVLVVFYYVALRPSWIRQDCSEQSNRKVTGAKLFKPSASDYAAAYDLAYNSCLHSHGL